MTVDLSDQSAVSAFRKTVSHSEVESFLRCERQHYYGYGLGIQRIAESESLNRGILGHEALAVFFQSLMDGFNFEDAQAKCYTFLGEKSLANPKIVAEILSCLHWFFLGYPFHGWTVLSVEQEFNLSVTDTLEMPFVIDLMIQDQFGEVWVIDHKFVYDFVSDRDAELLPQLVKYAAGLKVLGHHVDKVAFSSLRYRSMKTPEVANKYQLTILRMTPQRMRNTIMEQLIASERIQTVKSQPLEIQSRQALRTANKMVCNSCSFRSLCVAELNDDQPQLILDSEYKVRERREFSRTLEIEAM